MDTTSPPIPTRDPSAHAATKQPTTKEAVLPRTESQRPYSRFRILALDGGGIRGLLSARILQGLEARTGARLYDHVDLFAGTSTGSILAAGLACGYPIERIVEFYNATAAKVFADSWIDNVKDLGQILGAQYSLEPFREVLISIFGQRKLGDLDRRFLAVTFDLKSEDQPYRWKPKIFHNLPGPDSDTDEYLADVVLRSCAVPTYFPTYQGYIDGGVTGAVNPTMCAVAQALDPRNEAPFRLQLSDLLVLSVGPGRALTYIDGSDLDWGLAKWAPYLVDLYQDAPTDMADYEARQILGERYWRVQPVLPRKVDLDQSKESAFLEQVAKSGEVQRMVDEAADWVKRVDYMKSAA